jgi:hypothetical protein
MQKFLMLSVVLATICLPVMAARERRASRALKKTLLLIFAFNLFYLIAMRFFYQYLA